MKKQLEAIHAKMIGMISQAEELADSENETTAKKYEEILESLEAAMSGIEEAILLFSAE